MVLKRRPRNSWTKFIMKQKKYRVACEAATDLKLFKKLEPKERQALIAFLKKKGVVAKNSSQSFKLLRQTIDAFIPEYIGPRKWLQSAMTRKEEAAALWRLKNFLSAVQDARKKTKFFTKGLNQ